ncbi:outer membrane lipoprotein-sorting protein [Aquimarina aggregata]|uniref:outer membrane lipoprotein-sorting protein n=1 Tax=Aquimarina aggregata TaxID=1642818 RepID=UPI00249388D2|nr:outer membrane lipoprotein-sorting protein [Aquimarina aggregata]
MKIFKAIKLSAILVVFSLNVSVLSAQTGLEVMTKNEKQVFADDEKVDITMTLVNKKGKTRVRTINQVTKSDETRNRSSIIRFTSPSDVKGTSFLAIEYSDRDDDQWLYLPALSKTRRISSSNQTDNFVGSDFTYEDLATEDLEDFKYTNVKQETLDGQDCFLVEAIPVSESKIKETGYSKREIYVRKSDFVIAKVNFYDKNGVHFKTLTTGDIKKVVNNEKSRAYEISMNNLKTNHKTILKFSNFQINTGVETDLFSKRNLEKEYSYD